MLLIYLLDIHANFAAAGKADPPCSFIGNAELERLRLAAFDHVDGLRHNRAFDAATGHRAEEIALIVNDEVGADGAWGRAPGFHDGRERYAAAGSPPVSAALRMSSLRASMAVLPCILP